MKKVLAIVAIAGVFASCSNAADAEKRTQDSLDSVKREDSMKMTTPAPTTTTPSTSDTSTMAPMTSDTSSMKMSTDSMPK